MTKKHITLWLGCIVCETCSKASMTMKLHKEVNHKNSESITNFTDGTDLSERKCSQSSGARPEGDFYTILYNPQSINVLTRSAHLTPSQLRVGNFLCRRLQEVLLSRNVNKTEALLKAYRSKTNPQDQIADQEGPIA